MFIQITSGFKAKHFWPLALLPIVFVAFAANAQAREADATAILTPSTGLQVPSPVLHQLNGVKEVESYVTLPNRDQLVVYDTVRDDHESADFMDNHPHIAVIRDTKVLLNVDAVAIAPAGPVRFAGMALLPVSQNMPLMAFAFRLAVDQAGTFFVFIDSTTKSYRIAATLQGAQAQLRFKADSPGRFEFWRGGRPSSRSPDDHCVWCPVFYSTISYKWMGGKLARLGTVKSKHGYDPDLFFESPFLSGK